MKKINKNMKNKISIFAVTLVFVSLASTMFAMTTVSLLPADVSIEKGQIFNLVISVNSQVVKSYMIKSEIKFSADVLEVESFNFSNKWVPLSQPGYDLTDNTNGVLIKTAGYPGGLISQADFGTIVFKAKKSGVGTIQITGNSKALNADNLDVISGLPVQINVAITQKQVISLTPEPVVPPISKIDTQPKTTLIPAPEENTSTNLPVTEEKTAQSAAVSQTVAQNSLVATIGDFLTLGTSNVWLSILVGLIILAIIVYMIYLLRKRKNSGNI